MNEHGGYACPVCGHREYVLSLITQHVREEHPEESVK